jgi:hypothetical protein
MKRFRRVPFLGALTALAALVPPGKAQSAVDVGSFASISDLLSPRATHPQLDLAYRRPTERAKFRNYHFDIFGPHPIAGGAILGAIHQADKTPRVWGKGAKAYGQRVVSDFSFAVVTTGGNITREFIYGEPHPLFRRGEHSTSPRRDQVANSNQ